MYEDGTSLRTLATAFAMDDDETIRVLQRNGLVQQREGESWEAFAERIRQDVKHRTAA